ncbi:hypothetical protein G3M81_12450 [Bacillus paralicheniformis]|uniref:hypothetical protein n=1 Tax=Bacillus TaxID=1386 RepID=UPI0013EF56CF|nr:MULTISPECIES: hypothetical protein [Bacillus]MCY8609914.1 hypothetical protein [Bacillus haynesii]QII49500.1 hypothetical protein G3M81_12450 [Bacillus paralicheniformis]
MAKYSDIELEMMRDTLKQEMPVILAHLPDVAKIAATFYREFKDNKDVAESDVVSLSAKITASLLLGR